MPPEPGVTVYHDATPFTRGPFANPPLGVILHGSRSGLERPVSAEFDSTRQYCVTNPDGYAWQATIGEDAYSVHMPCSQWGWSAREASYAYLAVEFSQANLSDPVSDAQVRAFVAWFKAEALHYWPALDVYGAGSLPMHSELPAGIRDGKTDAFIAYSGQAVDLRYRIRAALGLGMLWTEGRARP